ncbi:MAG: hypothetical protein ABSE80_12900 [Halobacteriota archaeon]
MQPLIGTIRRTQISSNGSAYLSGVLMYRLILLVIGFTIHASYK